MTTQCTVEDYIDKALGSFLIGSVLQMEYLRPTLTERPFLFLSLSERHTGFAIHSNPCRPFGGVGTYFLRHDTETLRALSASF